MPKWENDSKVGKLSKRINHLKRVTKGGKGNILHALDMVLAELPQGEVYNTVSALRTRALAKLLMVELCLDDIDWLYEQLKDVDPEYKPKWPAKKRKGK